MKRKNRPKGFVNRAPASFISTLVLVCALAALTTPVGAGSTLNQALDPLSPRSPAADLLVLSQSAQTSSGTPGIVYNGGTVTYTLTLENQGSTAITNILVKDFLPREGETVYYLQNTACVTPDYACTPIDKTYEIPLPSGNTVEVAATREISWSIPSLGPGASVALRFVGQVLGQPDGTVFTNNAEATYSGNVVRSAPLSLTVVVLVDVSGEAGISTVPTWFSQDVGGTISQDWGDFDRDGLLDLALGSSIGVSVYRNDGENLSETPVSTAADDPYRPAYGVRWADVISDIAGCLELVVVGDSVNHSSIGAGINYVYHYDGSTFVEVSSFPSAYQLVRLEPGDVDADGDVDLIGSTNAINAPCNVTLYLNDGSGSFGTEACLSEYATAALAAGDYDRDGDLDLAVGAFPGTIQLIQNAGPVSPDVNPFDTDAPILLESFLEYIPYDLAWGDFDQDTDLDLAAAYPIQRAAQVYRNQSAVLTPFQSLTTGPFLTPLAIDWGDFNGDGQLELTVTDSPPAFYAYDATQDRFERWELDLPDNSGQIWSVRGIDLYNQANLDLVMTNRDGPSQIYPAFSPNLEPHLTEITPVGWGSNSVAWGDVDSDGGLDLLFGSSPAPNSSSYLYHNVDGTFPTGQGLADGFGPHVVAFGNVEQDTVLDMAIGAPAALLVYLDGAITSPIDVPSEQAILSLAWADPDDDGRLDLLVGYAADDGGLGRVALFHFDGATATTSFTATTAGGVRGLAWADVDRDYYLDFAAVTDAGALQLYRNTGDGAFELDWQSPSLTAPRAVAWADVDADGDLDLATGHYGTQDLVWENDNGAFEPTPIGPSDGKTTCLAWGDWNNDGYPELAVGTDDRQRDVVYANLGSEPGALRLYPLWQSESAAATGGLAWGDADGDGDLDLAVSRKGGSRSGFYENTMWPAAHFTGLNTLLDPALPNTPAYVSVARPGTTPDAYFYASPELVTGPNHPTVTIAYRLFDPEAVPAAETFFEYSLDGGGTWAVAAPDAASPLPTNETSRSGTPHTFVWNARADVAISDDARFRVRAIHQDPVGNSQRATSVGVSPPFRIRSLDCYWPAGAGIIVSNVHPELGEEIILTATLDYGSGQINATWDMGDSTLQYGWTITHTYTSHAIYTTILRLDGPACPVARPAYARADITVGLGYLANKIYLPLVSRSSTAARLAPAPAVPEAAPVQIVSGQTIPTPAPMPPAPAQATSSTEDTARAATMESDLIQVSRNRIGFQNQPTINSDGRYVAFWSTGDFDSSGQRSNPDGNIEIFLAEIESVKEISYTQVTSSTGSILGGFSLYPDIDAAGNTVAFFSDGDLIEGENADLNFEIFVAEINNGIPYLTQVTHTPRGVNIMPSISSNGRRVVFISNQDLDGGRNADGNQEVFVAELDNVGQVSAIVQTTDTSDCFNDRPSLSQDGRFAAYVSNCDGNREIRLVEFDSSGQAVATLPVTDSASGYSDNPSINGDGSRIAFVSTMGDAAGPAQVYVTEIDTGGPDVLSVAAVTDDDKHKAHPAISADGLRLAYIRIESPTVRRLSLYDVQNRNEVLLDTGDDNVYPALDADGRGMAFIANWDVLITYPPDIDLRLTKAASPAIVGAEDPLTYTLSVTNQGSAAIAGSIISDTLPYGVAAQLPEDLADYVDDDGTISGFGGGTPNGASWDPDAAVLTMDDPSSGEVYFDSRVMHRGNGAHGWNSVALLPERPIGMPMPDNNTFETGYPTGNVDMADNALLLHFDDLVNSEVFLDTSGGGHDMTCPMASCPAAGQEGVLGNALTFDPAYHQSITRDNTDPATSSDLVLANDFTIALWANPESIDRHAVMISKHVYIPSGDGDVVHFGINSGLYRFKLRDVVHEEGAAQTGWQHLVVVGRTIDAGTRTEVALYRNGDVLWAHTYNTIADDVADGMWGVGNDFDGEYGADNFFDGGIDEVAVFNRALDAQEVEDIYLRGALRVRFQVRSCDQVTCPNQVFVGPDRTSATYYPAYNADTVLYYESFEDDNGGYTHSGAQDEWQWGDPLIWPSDCASGQACWGTDLFGNYNDYANQTLQSTNISLDGALPGATITVEWWQAWFVESAWYDQAYAEISTDGGATWQRMWTHTTSTTQVGWTRMTYSFQATANQTVVLRWHLNTDYSVTYPGYYIDAVRVTASQPPGTFDDDYFGRYPPAFLVNVPQERPYFQYRAYLNTYDDTQVPEIPNITVSPQVNCAGTSAVACYLDPYVPLAQGSTVTWNIPTLVTADAYEEATPHGTDVVITNTATVEGIGFELSPGDNRAAAETLLETNQVGDFVWVDTDGDGIQDTGEPGLAGVTVHLYDPGNDGQVGGVGSDADQLLRTTTTDSNGYYSFPSLPTGKYFILFEAPAGHAFTEQDVDNNTHDAVDSDADASGYTAVFGLDAGITDNSRDAGLYQPVTLGDFVWEDANGDGIQAAGEAGMAVVTVKLYNNNDSLVDTTTTDSDGIYHFYDVNPGRYYICFTAPSGYVFTRPDVGSDNAVDSDANRTSGCTTTFNVNSGASQNRWDAGLCQPAALGDFVWQDTNADGIQDAGEPGLDGVTVQLYTGSGTLVASTTTAGGGAYSFTGLGPNEYYLLFTAPAGYYLSPQNQGGDDATDSDANTSTGRTATTTLVPGENDTTWDTGLYQRASIGNRTWIDTNGNGLQDSGESGLNGVTVRLYTAGGSQVGSATTAGGGLYNFSSLLPGDYYLIFVAPTGYTFTSANAGGDTIDSDANPATGRTATTTLSSGESDVTWDAGFVTPPP
ncbi:MAG: VCBS repeat-containing protein [Anaerolineae bacterium]|nr:VCBS repeat-containing protein [Anaerolineae bacterium]